MEAPKRKTKTKTFTGCWTCRSRKVKCDLNRPSCNRCTKARLHCQGYSVQLYWVAQDELSLSLSSVRRQAMTLPLGNPHWAPGDVGDVDAHLYDVDRYAAGAQMEESAWSGPFGVLRLRTEGQSEVLITTPQGANIDVLDIASLGEVLPEEQCEEVASQSSLDSFLERVYDVESPGRLLFANASGHTDLSLQLRSLCDDTVSVPGFVATNTHTDGLVGTLLDHYLRNVTNLLQPVLHSRNAYSSIYANEAMAVARRAPWRDVAAHGDVWDSKVALVYSLLTSSSFHLRGFDRSDDANAMARYFRVKAVSSLRVALASLRLGDQYSDVPVPAQTLSKYEAVLTVMLTLVTADILDGQMDEFWIHLDATKQLVPRLQGQVQPRSAGEHLVNISYFLRILSDSTDMSLEPTPWSPAVDGSADFLGGGHSLEFTYGITARLANFLSRACLLARNAAFYKTNSDSPPEGFTLACDELVEDMAAWHVSQEALTSFRASDELTVFLISKHIVAFAAGIQIYFHTRVAAPYDEATVEVLVRKVASTLTEIEDIKRRTGYNASPTATISWPGFMASCQAKPSERRIWERWWHRMLDYRIGNINDLWSVVREAWSVQDADETGNDAPWTVVLRRAGRRILAI